MKSEDKGTVIVTLQWLRALSAVMVIINHITLKEKKLGIVSSAFDIGAIGVDIFFVISGFMMAHIFYTKKPTAKKFILDRIKRILPLYYLFTIASLILLLISPKIINTDTKTAIWQSFLFIPLKKGELTYLVMVGWTLCYEVMFYLIFTISLLIKKESALYTASFITLVISMYGILLGGNSSNIYISGASNPIMIEFVFGMAAYEISRLRSSLLVTIIISTLAIFTFTPSEADDRYVSWGVPSLALVLIANYAEKFITKKNWLSYIGDCSYEIYLSHIYAIGLIYYSMKIFHLPVDNQPFLIICFIFSIATGVICKNQISERIKRMNLPSARKRYSFKLHSE